MNARLSTVPLWLITMAGLHQIGAQDMVAFDGFKLVDKFGNIAKPDDYRDRYQMLGAYAVIDPKGKQMHFTYASPGAAAYYRRSKTFADGTVFSEGNSWNRPRAVDYGRC